MPALWIIVVLLGIVEGLTEFIPVSSTGHLILADELLGFRQALQNDEKSALFGVFIQLGAILAIALIYRAKLLGVATRSLTANGPERRLALALALAFVPAAGIGFLFHDVIEGHLLRPLPVACAFVVGGILILVIEALPIRVRARSTEELTLGQALGVGLAQVLSLVPGTSRSGATIMGGLGVGLDRRTATEFSFLLSFPVMVAASGYSLLKHRKVLDPGMIGVLALGFGVAFASAWVVVRWLIGYVQTHSFRVFAFYRIAFGLLLLVLIYTGFVKG